MYSLNTPASASTGSSPRLHLTRDALSQDSSSLSHHASPLRYILGFLLIGLAWGFTTPFIRAAARAHRPGKHPILQRADVVGATRWWWPKRRVYAAVLGVLDLVRDPAYAVPLLVNLTGSVWFFLLIGSAELSLQVPIVNTLAFMFTVLGDYVVDEKVVSKDTWMGMILSLSGIALCVYSKT